MPKTLALTDQWINTSTGEVVTLPANPNSERNRFRIAALRAGRRQPRLFEPAAYETKAACRCGNCRWWRKLRNELGWVVGLATIAAVVLSAAGHKLLP